MSHGLRLTDANFEKEVFESDLPVLVNFWASWCPPCKMTEPMIKVLAQQYGERLRIMALNVDQNHRTASKYSIQGVPTFILFKSGKELGRRVGAQSKTQLRQMLTEAL